MSDDKDLRSLILSMKQELLKKNGETENNIIANINAIKENVQANKEQIEKINERLDKLENKEEKSETKPSYAEATSKHKFLLEARKIVGLMPINDDDI